MKRIITIAFLLACFFSYGQPIQLFYEKQYVNPDDTLTIIVPSNESSDHYLDIVNMSEGTIQLMIRRELLSLLPDAENLFCMGAECLNASENETTQPYPFLAGDTLSPDTKEYDFFHTTYIPNNKKGISLIKYTFYDQLDFSGGTSVIFKFDSETVGIGNKPDMAHLNVYPNPTNSELRISNYELREDAVIEIYDVVGKKQEIIINCQLSIVNSIDVSCLASGMYFLKVNNKVVKFVKE